VHRAAVRFRIRFEYASFAALATIVAIAAAIAGLVAENVVTSGGGRARPEAYLATGTMAVTHPASWRRIAAPAIPWLKLEDEVALAPAARGAGLVLGSVPASDGPLPRGLVARLDAPSRTEVVTFGGFDAYRYSGLHVGGFNGRLTLYAVPKGSSFTVAACYAPAGGGRQLLTCERLVATLNSGSTADYTLAPGAGYARAMAAALARLNVRRSADRARLGGQDAAGQAAVAGRLGAAYGDAASTMSTASPPAPAGPVNDRLVADLRAGATAYRALGSATSADDGPGYERARSEVGRAEANVDATLLELRALGYGGNMGPR
jgi:hypothetical protein